MLLRFEHLRFSPQNKVREHDPSREEVDKRHDFLQKTLLDRWRRRRRWSKEVRWDHPGGHASTVLTAWLRHHRHESSKGIVVWHCRVIVR